MDARVEEIYKRLLELANRITDERLRSITIEILRNPKITFTDVDARIRFLESPAAPQKHHSYPGGLIDHTYSVSLSALALAEIYSKVYGVDVDKDIVLSCALLHDIFKYYQYEKDPITGGFRIRSDWFLSHEFSIIAELSRRGAPERLLRCLAEVHGSGPFTTFEGLIVHEADSADASYMSTLQNMLWSICRDVEADIGVSAIKIFHRILSEKHVVELVKIYYSEGREGLIKLIKKIVQEK